MRSLGCLLAIVVALFALCNGAYLPSGPKIIGYWGCQPGNLPTTTSQLQTALNKGYNVIIFAFYLVDDKGSIFKDYGSVPAPTKSSITQNGKDFSYLISLFGGENGSAKTMTMTPDAWARTMFNNFDALSKQYGFDGIDIDLENSWGGSGDAVACGLRLFFKYMHDAEYVVSMAPQTTAVTPEVPFYATGSWNSYVPLLDESIIEYVDIVAIQLYNNAVPYNSVPQYTTALSQGFSISGCPACDDGKTTRKVKIPASKLAHGYPSTIGAAPAHCPGTAFTANGKCFYGNDLYNLYSNPILLGTGGVMTWAVEWDGKDAK